MIFILLGTLLLLMKLGEVHPIATWGWHSIAWPFLLALCWFELFEPLLGLDVKRQLLKKRRLEEQIRHVKNKKPRR